jgi:hypothetical protein
LSLRASKAGSAAGFPIFPRRFTASFILERLLLPKSLRDDSKSFASAIENEKIPTIKKTPKSGTMTLQPLMVVFNIRDLTSRQVCFIRKNFLKTKILIHQILFFR